MSKKNRVIDSYQQRLTGALHRSPLLKASVSKSGRLVDFAQLESVSPGLAKRLLETVIQASTPLAIDLNLRAKQRARTAGGSKEQPVLFSPQNNAGINPSTIDHSALYDLLDRRMRRHAEMAKRETGVHALWLGYPLIYVPGDGVNPANWILSPVFLWPVAIELDLRREGRFRIGRHQEPKSKEFSLPVFNLAMATWVSRQLKVNMPEPSEEELEVLDCKLIKDKLRVLGNQFQNRPSCDCDGNLEPIPDPKRVASQTSSRFYNSAVMGYIRQPNEAIMSDLVAIKSSQECADVVAAFVEGLRLPEPAPVKPPPEEDRYHVSSVDFSQEKVIWQARQPPGLVVHGPPGTGKSQTIVNIIADALAHERTVLMVCQKKLPPGWCWNVSGRQALAISVWKYTMLKRTGLRL
jgi:hypothetical protein